MDEVIICPNCNKSDLWVIGTSGVRCSSCQTWVTHSAECYRIVETAIDVKAAEDSQEGKT